MKTDEEYATADVYVLGLDQSTPTPLTKYWSWDEDPVWSPDSRQILYQSLNPMGLYLDRSLTIDDREN